MRKTIALMIILVCFVAGAQGQSNLLIDQGNKLYEQHKYNEASSLYQKALTKTPNFTPGLFNLGNSLYQQKKFEASRQVMTATEKSALDKNAKAAASYNIGNTYMEEKKWEDAVKSYKQTLRNNPQDADAKYNLSYAQEMLKKQQGGGGKNNQQDKDKKQDQKQDQKQQNNDDKKQDQQNKDNQDQNKDQQKQDQQKQQQSQPSKLNQQQADQLLNALQQEEKKLHDKNKKEKGIPVKMEKDW